MASNNSQRSQQQGWIPKGGGGWKRNTSSSPHQSEVNLNSIKEDVMYVLQDMFIDVLDLEIIQSVAQNCEYNLHASVEALMMLSEDADICKSPVLSNASQLLNNAASANLQTKKANVPELLQQAKIKKEAKLASRLAPGSFVHKPQATTGRDRASSPALGAIKVTYKSPNNCEESDSDADVVIEEEKEYVVVGNSASVNLVREPFSVPQVSYGLMHQYSMPVVPQLHGQGQGKSPPKAKKTAQMPTVVAAVTTQPNITASSNLLQKKLSSAHMAQQKQFKPQTIPERVQKLIREGTRVMVLMRGAPGSGKTHLALQIVRLTMGKNCDPNKYIFSTDDFFVRTKRFIPSMLPEAHNWNKDRVRAAAERKLNPIFVDNTNTEIWEMKPYAELAVSNGYVLELLEPFTLWRYQEPELVRRNTHGVPRQQIQNMLARFEKNLTGKLLLMKLGLKYSKGNQPPQPAANAPPQQAKEKVKNKTKPQAAAVIPIATKTKKKKKKKKKNRRRKKSKTASQLLQVPQQPARDAQDSSLMDALALFLAKKALEEGQSLDPKVANSRLTSGVTISDILLPKKENIPQPAVKMWEIHDSLASEGSVVNACSLVDMSSEVKDGSSSSDASSDDGSCEEEEDDDDDDDDDEEEEDEEENDDDDDDDDDAEPHVQELGEWQVNDNEWQYQSDNDAQGVKEELNETNNLKPVPSGGEQCWEYILVMGDSKWVYQKHHPETQNTRVQEDPESTTEPTEGLLIDLSAGSADMVASDTSKLGFLVNAEQNIGTKTSNENLLMDLLSKAEDNLENGVQEFLSPIDAAAVEDRLSRQTQFEASVPSHPFSLDEFDKWLCNLPVEPGTEAIHWPAPSSERSEANSAVKPNETEVAAVPVAQGVSVKRELCPLGLEISPLVPLAEEKVMPENVHHVLKTDIAFKTRPETDADILQAEFPDSNPSLHESTGPELFPSSDMPQHTSEPCPQTADGSRNEDKYHNAVSSEEASSNGKKEVPTKEKKVEAKDLLISIPGKAAPTYDLLTWFTKSKKKDAEDEEEVWQQESAWVNNVEFGTKPADNTCGPREQRSSRRVVERKLKQSSDVEVQEAEAMPPDLQAWETVAEAAKSWENKGTQQDGQKASDDPQPQRSIFASEGSSQAKQGGSGTCFMPSRMATILLRPDDFVQSSWENRLVNELQKIALTNVASQDSAVMDSAEINAVQAVTNASTNTDYSDFALMLQLNRPKDSTVTMEGIKIITGHNRSIMEGVVPLKHFDRPVPFTLKLDKSSMAMEEDNITTTVLVSAQEVNAEKNHDFIQLVAMFPNAPRESLKEIFEKCCGNLNWTVDLLLESKLDQFAPLSPSQDSKPTTADTGGSIFQGLPVIDISNPEPSAPTLEAEDMAPPSEQSEHLKRQLDENCSEHTLRIRKLQHGELLDMGEVTTKPQQSPPSSSQVVDETTLGAIGFSGTRTPTPQSGDVADPHRNGIAVDEDADSSSSCAEEEEMLPVALDPGFVSQLHQMFGNPSLPCPEDVEPVVNLPLSLARQIHYYLVESQLMLLEQQQKQMEQMIQEDEQLARQLQEQEQEGSASVPNLQEIMDMDKALALYRREEAQCQGKETKDDLATKLKKQVLYELFPNLDKDVLLEVFVAHGKSLEKTLEEVMSSVGDSQEEGVQTVTAPKALAAYGHSLLEQAKQEQRKVRQEDMAGATLPLPIVVVRDPTDASNTMSPKEQAMEDAKWYRNEASRHYQLRQEYFQKAQVARNKGRTAIASYYYQMASLHKQRIDDANARAAASLLSTHTLAQDDGTTLDLHYLHVPEALQALDLFLDHHIAKLLEWHTKQSLYLITGRGLRSSDGKSRIRPAVEGRLRQRGMKWSVVNPGLLKVVVRRHSPLSSDISTNS